MVLEVRSVVTFEGGKAPGRGLRRSWGTGHALFLGGGLTGVHFGGSRLVVSFFFCMYAVF